MVGDAYVTLLRLESCKGAIVFIKDGAWAVAWMDRAHGPPPGLHAEVARHSDEIGRILRARFTDNPELLALDRRRRAQAW